MPREIIELNLTAVPQGCAGGGGEKGVGEGFRVPLKQLLDQSTGNL